MGGSSSVTRKDNTSAGYNYQTGVNKYEYDQFMLRGTQVGGSSNGAPTASEKHIYSGYDDELIVDRDNKTGKYRYDEGDAGKFKSITQETLDQMSSMFSRRETTVEQSKLMPGRKQTSASLLDIG